MRACRDDDPYDLVLLCCRFSHQAMVKLLSITQRTNSDDEMWDRHFKAVLLILLDLMKDEDVSCCRCCDEPVGQ